MFYGFFCDFNVLILGEKILITQFFMVGNIKALSIALYLCKYLKMERKIGFFSYWSVLLNAL